MPACEVQGCVRRSFTTVNYKCISLQTGVTSDYSDFVSRCMSDCGKVTVMAENGQTGEASAD